jgi:hypothetical protein
MSVRNQPSTGGQRKAAIAFSRRGNLESGEAEDAVVLKVFGAILEDFDMV